MRLSARVALVLVFVVGLASAATPASTHRADSFDLCIGYGFAEGYPCHDMEHVLTGDHPRLLGTIVPHHSGQLAGLWRRAPLRSWTKVAMVWINAKGHMRWGWTPRPGDARRWRPWRA